MVEMKELRWITKLLIYWSIYNLTDCTVLYPIQWIVLPASMWVAAAPVAPSCFYLYLIYFIFFFFFLLSTTTHIWHAYYCILGTCILYCGTAEMILYSWEQQLPLRPKGRKGTFWYSQTYMPTTSRPLLLVYIIISTQAYYFLYIIL